MTEPPTRPTLTPIFCFNERFLRDFLRLSRSQIDDSISTNLNALLTPSRRGFDPSSTQTRQARSSGREPIPQMGCKTFTEQVLFPSWQARSDVLAYCTSVATSPDPSDPQKLETETYNRRDRDKIVNERLDPYSGRYYPKEARTEQLAALLRNEEAIERIIRTKTWQSVCDRCQGMDGSQKWEDALDKWREGSTK